MAGDFNGDGRLDLAVIDRGSRSGSGGGVSVLLGNGDGTFQPAKMFAAPGGYRSVAGRPSTGGGGISPATAASTSLSQLRPATSTCCWATATVHSRPGGRSSAWRRVDAYTLVAGDFNGDGRLDLATADYDSNDIAVLLNKGDGSFAAPELNVVEAPPYAIAAGDFNGDGKLDLATSDDGFPPKLQTSSWATATGRSSPRRQSPVRIRGSSDIVAE